jgi:hypothetical protein
VQRYAGQRGEARQHLHPTLRQASEINLADTELADFTQARQRGEQTLTRWGGRQATQAVQ